MFEVKGDGTKRIAILAYDAGDGNPDMEKGGAVESRKYWVHRGVGTKGPGNRGETYCCLRKTFNKKCPGCERHAEILEAEGKDAAKDLLPKRRQLYNVFDFEDQDKGVQIWDISYHLFTKRLHTEISKQDEDENFNLYADEEDGSLLKLGLTERSYLGNKFTEIETVSFKQPRPDIPDEILDSVFDLDAIPKEVSYQEFQDALDDVGEDNEGEGGGEDPPEPVKAKKDKKKKKKKDKKPKSDSADVGTPPSEEAETPF